MGSRHLILAIPLEIGAEAVRNAILATLVRRFPFDASDSVKWNGLQIDWSDSLSRDLGSVLVFAGSLSHPPCTESVIWMLSRKPLRLPEDQLLELTKLLRQGARATQPLNQRPVLGLSAKP
jgi:carbonic anhydrase